MAAVSGRKVGDELTKLWGWENCKDIKIHFPLNGLVEIVGTFNATKEQIDGLVSVIKKYRLEEIAESENNDCKKG